VKTCGTGAASMNSSGNGAGVRIALPATDEQRAHESRCEMGICLQLSASAWVAICALPEPEMKSRSACGATSSKPVAYTKSNRIGIRRRWVIGITFNVMNGDELVKRSRVNVGHLVDVHCEIFQLITILGIRCPTSNIDAD
jgi:hypothetical protein